METVVHNISDLGGSQRSAAEQLVGHPLRDDQQLVIQIVSIDIPTTATTQAEADIDNDKLPEWCNVYAGMSEAEIAELERAISRRLDFTRPATS
jgi:hypothetical protein